MFKYLISTVFSICVLTLYSQSVHYDLAMDNPNSHYFNVKMEISDVSSDELVVKMPVWAPGSYLVREFSKNLDQVKAYGETGVELPIEKIAKNAWKIKRGKAKLITVDYDVYAFELSVRTSFLDNSHGYVSGTGVFMYLDGNQDKPGTLTIRPHRTFSKITTALPRKKEGLSGDGTETEFVYTNYDQLVDCPIEIGNQEVFNFTAAGVNHTVAMYGIGNYNIEQLKVDMANIVESATKVFGQNPNKEYTFIIHNVVDGQGGLEHTNSTTLSVNRWTYDGKEYLGFLSLVAHEYFHLWNVKRIRPIELGPFNYDEENYTSLLWVMEGFTSYYDELLLLRAGYYDQEQYLKKFMSTLNYVEGSTGARVQPVAHASYDAWIKAYRPNENSSNTTVSYYSKGSIIAAMIDAMIIDKTKGKKSLDDFLQVLYEDFYVKKGRGFTEMEFKEKLEKIVGKKLDDFFEKYIHGTEIPPYNEIFAPIGMNVTYSGEPSPDAGLRLGGSGGIVTVSRIRRDSPAEKAGLSVGDEIISVNGFRVDKGSLEEFLNTMNEGDQVDIIYAREQILGMTRLTMELYEQPQFEHSVGTGKETEKLRAFWLRSDQ